jgi:hypothetical protein
MAVLLGAPAGVIGVTVAYLVLTLVMLVAAVFVTRRTAGIAPAVVLGAAGFHLLGLAVGAGVAALLTGTTHPVGIPAVAALAVSCLAGVLLARLLAPSLGGAAWGFWGDVLNGRAQRRSS